MLALSRDAFGSSLFARFASSQHLDFFHLTFSFFASDDLCSGLRALDHIDDSFTLLVATLLVFHQVFYDLLIPQFDVQRVRELSKKVGKLRLLLVMRLLQ